MKFFSNLWDKVTGTGLHNQKSEEKENIMATVKDAIKAIESHERECKVLYKSIDRRLEEGSKRFDKLENMIWAVYPFIVGAIVIAEFI